MQNCHNLLYPIKFIIFSGLKKNSFFLIVKMATNQAKIDKMLSLNAGFQQVPLKNLKFSQYRYGSLII